MKYIDADKLTRLLDAKYKEFMGKAKTEGYTTLQYQYMADGIDIAEQLIDSLQQEQPEVDIKKEIKDWCKENVTGVNPIYTADSLMCALLPKCACHFYELGRQAKPEIFDTAAFQKGVEEGRRLEREDVKSTIQSRIDEILGDAQPNPILRMELQELIKKIEL